MLSYSLRLYSGLLFTCALASLTFCVLHARAVADEADAYQGKPIDHWVAQLQRLDDENKELRRRAAYALGQIGPAVREAPAVDGVDPYEALLTALEDRQLEVRWYALDALGRIGPKRPVDGAAHPHTEQAVVGMIDAIENPPLDDPDIQRVAAKALGRFGAAATPAADVLNKALNGSLEVDTKESDKLLLRVEAAYALWRIRKDRAAALSLLEIIQSKDDNAAYAACMALLEFGSAAKGAAPLLVQTLGRENPDIRRAAVKVLGEIGAPATTPITAALNDGKKISHCDAAEALGIIADGLRTGVLYKKSATVDDQRQAMQLLSEQIVPAAIKLLADAEEEVRTTAARTLARSGLPAAAPLLVAVRSEDENAQAAAADALIRLERCLPASGYTNEPLRKLNAAIAPELLAGLRSPSREVNYAALRAFSALPVGREASEAVDLLRPFLRDRDVAIRRYAGKALDRIRSASE
jgi:HEAT repeat protein